MGVMKECLDLWKRKENEGRMRRAVYDNLLAMVLKRA